MGVRSRYQFEAVFRLLYFGDRKFNQPLLVTEAAILISSTCTFIAIPSLKSKNVLDRRRHRIRAIGDVT